jgi:hypothetical protein
MRWIYEYNVDEVDPKGRPTKRSLCCETSNHGGVKKYVQFVVPKGYVYGRCRCGD